MIFYSILFFYSILYIQGIFENFCFVQFIVGFTFCMFDQGVENTTATVERIIILGFVFVNITHF